MSHVQIHCQIQGYKDLSLSRLLFVALAVTFRSLIILCKIFMWYKVRVQLHFLTYRNPVVPALFVEKTILAPLEDLETLSKNHQTLNILFINSTQTRGTWELHLQKKPHHFWFNMWSLSIVLTNIYPVCILLSLPEAITLVQASSSSHWTSPVASPHAFPLLSQLFWSVFK